MLLGWVGAAFALDTCGAEDLARVPDALAVAWVSPLGKHVNRGTWLPLVPTSEIRQLATEHAGDDAVRVLQWLGLRASSRPPTRRYKVVVFDVTRDELCRPILSGEPALAGVRPCDADHAGPRGRYEGCGTLTDLRTGQPSATLLSAQWEVVSRDGFCVLPLERFLAAAGPPAPLRVDSVGAGGGSGRP